MTIKPSEASAMLADVDAIIAKVKRSRIYCRTGDIMIVWGLIVIAGNLLCSLAPRWSAWIWIVVDGLGLVATFFMLQRGAPRQGRFPLRFLAAFVLFCAFGSIWSGLIGRFGPRELDAFWPTLFLFGYALAGIWFGAALSALGLGLSALILAGYLWSGEWFTLWLAVFNGGGLILCGALMRRG
jgi:hypothetical protein